MKPTNKSATHNAASNRFEGVCIDFVFMNVIKKIEFPAIVRRVGSISKLATISALSSRSSVTFKHVAAIAAILSFIVFFFCQRWLSKNISKCGRR